MTDLLSLTKLLRKNDDAMRKKAQKLKDEISRKIALASKERLREIQSVQIAKDKIEGDK